MKNKTPFIFCIISFLLIVNAIYAAPLSEVSGSFDINMFNASAGVEGAVTTTTTTTTTAAAPASVSTGGVAVTGTGAAAATTTTTAATTTTTVAPPVEETTTVGSIGADETAAFTYTTEGLAITEISVQVANAVSNAQIKITKTTAAPATIAIAAPDNVYAYLQIEKTNIADEDITSATIKFKVEKSWVEDNGIDVSTISLNRYVDGAWTTVVTTLVSSDDGYYYFEATSPGLSVFAITAKKFVTTTTTTAAPPIVIPIMTVEWIAGVLVLLIMIGVLIYIFRKKSLGKKHVF